MSGTVLGTNPGFIQLVGAELDAPPGGLTFAARQGLIGLGAISSKVLGSPSGSAGDAVVTLAGSRSSVESVWVRVGIASGVGVRVTVSDPAGTSGAPGTSNENSRLTNIFCENQTANAIAFGIGDNTGLDVSEVVMIGCDSVGQGASSIHMQVGNGDPANVGDITNIGGNSQGNNYGVIIYGGWLVSRGLNFESSGTADIWLNTLGRGNISFDGGRSENALRFIVTGSSFVIAYASVKFSNYTVVGLQNTDGQGVQLDWPATVENVVLLGAKAPQYFYLRGGGVDTDYPQILTARDCVSEHPFPFQTNWSRPGKIIRSSGTRFVGDQHSELRSRNTTSDTWVRRTNVTSTAPFTINPFFYDAIDINLAGSGTGSGASAPVILPGAVGQTITICYQQDGFGGWAFAWPELCAWSAGSPPSSVIKPSKKGTRPHNRQSCTFRYNGRYWEQIGPVTNVLPPAITATPITDNFTTPVDGGVSFWLNQPDTLPVPVKPPPHGNVLTPTTPVWEHVPGGGSLGINNGPPSRCATLCLGYVGDNNTEDGQGLFGPGAAAVIETGMATQPTGISATFTWQKAEGIIAHYLDDQTFVIFSVQAADIVIRGWSHGVPITSGGNVAHGLKTVTPGSTHTLLVQCTNTAGTAGFNINLDGGAFTHSMSFDAVDSKNLASFTKHGIFSSVGVEAVSPAAPATFTNFTAS